MIYRLLTLFGLALAGVAVWLTLSPRQGSPVTAHASRPAVADEGYSASNASVVETGLDGAPLYTLQAKQVQQEPDSDLINLTTVHMTFRDDSGGQWQAHSNTAVAQQDSAQIDLNGAVDVYGTFAGDDQPAHIVTDTLHVDTHANIIRTNSAVTLTWAGHVVDARGMVVNIKDHNVKLEADVHGHYVP